MEQNIPSWEANSFQLVKNFSAYYGSRTLITGFKTARHVFPLN